MERHISRYVASSIPFHFCPAVYVSHQGMGGPSFLLLLALSPLSSGDHLPSQGFGAEHVGGLGREGLAFKGTRSTPGHTNTTGTEAQALPKDASRLSRLKGGCAKHAHLWVGEGGAWVCITIVQKRVQCLC